MSSYFMDRRGIRTFVHKISLFCVMLAICIASSPIAYTYGQDEGVVDQSVVEQPDSAPLVEESDLTSSDESAPTEVPAVEPSPTPTPTIEPSPTPTPTIEPSPALMPTESPTTESVAEEGDQLAPTVPTLEPTEEPTAEPVVTPTTSTTESPTSEPLAPVEPTPVGTPAPARMRMAAASEASVVCTPSTPDTINPGGTYRLNCSYEPGPDLVEYSRLVVPALPAGFTAQGVSVTWGGSEEAWGPYSTTGGIVDLSEMPGTFTVNIAVAQTVQPTTYSATYLLQTSEGEARTSFVVSFNVVAPTSQFYPGNLMSCAQYGSATFQPGTTVPYRCQFTATTPGAFSVLYMKDAQSQGWTSKISWDARTRTSTMSSYDRSQPYTASPASSVVPVNYQGYVDAYLDFRIPVDATPGSTYSQTVHFCAFTGPTPGSCPPQYTYSYTFGGTVGGTAKVSFACTPMSVSTGLNQAVSFTCTVSGLSGLATNETVRLNQTLGVELMGISGTSPVGWSANVTTPHRSLTRTGENISWIHGSTNVSVGRNQSASFTVTLTPTTCVSLNEIRARVTWNYEMSSNPGAIVAGTPQTISASFNPAANSGATVVIGSPARVTTPYSAESSSPLSSGIVMTVSSSGCSGWSVTMTGSDFVRIDSGPTVGVPQHQNAAVGAPVVTAGSPIQVSGVPAPVDIASGSPEIVRSRSSNGSAVVSIPIMLNYSVPANTLVGEYRSIIGVTITTTAAP